MKILKSFLNFVMDILETITFAASIFLVIYLFIVQPNQVKGASMEPTFKTGDCILTSKVTYKIRNIQRGDIIVFRSPKNPDIEFIKRVIGLSGDEVIIKQGEVYINGVMIPDNYTLDKTQTFDQGFAQENVPINIPLDQIFAMGDNRPRSSDSREFGPVNKSSIIGQVFYLYYPPQKMGWIKNPLPTNLRSMIEGGFITLSELVRL